MIVNANDNVMQIQSKRRKKEGESSKSSKSQRLQVEAADNVENVDSNQAEEADAVTPTVERVAEATSESPICISTLSSPEPETPESCADAPTQSRANANLVTFNSLNSDSVAKLRQERDRLECGGSRKRRDLLRQLDRSTWPAPSMILRLHGHLPVGSIYEDKGRFDLLKRVAKAESFSF